MKETTDIELHFYGYPSLAELVAYDFYFNFNTKGLRGKIKPEWDGRRVYEAAEIAYIPIKEMLTKTGMVKRS